MGALQLQAAPVLLAVAHVVLGIVILILARLLKTWLSPYRMDEELTSKDNPAFGLALAGYYLGVVIVFLGTARAQTASLEAGTVGILGALGLDLAWTVAGIVALAFSRRLMDRTLVAKGCQSEEIVRNRNIASGAVECCVYASAGIVLAGALREPGGSIWTALVFFLLSQVVLLLFGRVYQLVAGYEVAREIRGGNLAAGAAFGLTLVAIALLMLKATSGEFLDWGTNLAYFGFDAVAGFGLLLLLRWIVDAALLPNARIAEEIVRDRNLNVGLLEGVLAAGVAAIILVVF
jgi:uncharacterized membrane protein YjfL (UPF0719 family)